ncbi:hypothetical protein UlMin_032393 [Ulmus minor]
MLKEANILAYQWLSVNATSEWSKSAFREGPKCDTLLNNLCESFNSTILSAREKCILTMLEQLSEYLMCRMASKRDAMSKWVHLVGPRILKLIEKNKAVARLKFQLSGIPCGLALACIYSRNYNVYEFIHSFYKKDSYEKTYAPIIYPMPHPGRWPNDRQITILPPFKTMPGRPKKMRRQEASEPPAPIGPRTKARRFNMVIHCRNCNELGHYFTALTKMNKCVNKHNKHNKRNSKILLSEIQNRPNFFHLSISTTIQVIN